MIQALGEADIDVRESVFDALRKIASKIDPILREHLGDADPEIAARCRDLIGQSEEQKRAERRVLVGRVIFVERKFNFILLDSGRERGFSPGEEFDLLRKDGAGRLVRVAGGTFEKYIGGEERSSKILLSPPGADVRPDDSVARLAPDAPDRGEKKVPKVAAPEPPMSGKVALVDSAGGRVALDTRERDGARKGDRLSVLREGSIVGTLELTDVQAWGSWAVPAADTKLDNFRKGDVVHRPAPK